MMKFTVGLALLILCVSVQAQTPRPDLRHICRRQNERCVSQENRNGRTNEVTNIFNNHCRTKTSRSWRNVTRCELARANCELTLVRCSTLSCENVRRTIASGGGGGRTTPRSPTIPTETPLPNPDPDSPPTRTPRPRTTRRPRTTTRRTPTTRRGGRTTTRRTTTRRGGRRTTTPRIPTTRTARPPRD